MRSTFTGFEERYDFVRPLDVTTLLSTFLARERGADIPCIVILPRTAPLESLDALRRFYAAVEKARSIQHPRLLPILDAGRIDEEVWVSYAHEPEDTTLEDILTRRSPLRTILDITAQVAEGLDALHQANVLHTDVRPSNVVWRAAKGTALLWNPGAGHLARGVAPTMRESLNSPHPPYLAPEMEEHPGFTRATDIYALGCLLYEMLTGNAPFTGTNPATIFAKQKTQGIRVPTALHPALPAHVEAVLLHALEYDPGNRYATAGDMARALRAAIADLTAEHAALPTPPAPETAERPALFHRHADISSIPSSQRRSERVVLDSQGRTWQEGVDRSQGFILCPVCQHTNPAIMDSCANCWQSLVNQPILTRQEAGQRSREYQRRRFIRRALIRGIPALLVLVLAVWVLLPRTGPGEGMAAPAGTLSAVSGPNDWAYYRQSPDGVSAVTTDSPIPQGALKWKFDAGSALAGAPVVAGDRIFVAYQDNHLAALDRETGAVLWQVSASGPVRGAPTVAGDRVLIGQLNTHITAFDVATGQVVWDTLVDESVVHPVNVHDGVVYASGLDGTLFTLDVQTGARRWDLHLAGSLQSPPIVLGNTLVVGTSDRSFNVMNARTGRVTLDYVSDRAVESGAIIDAQRRSAYFGSNRGSVFGVNIDATNKPFEKTINYWWTQLYIWNLAPAPKQSGTKWVFPVAGQVRSGLALAHGNVYAGSERGILYAINADTGKQTWKFPSSGSVGNINTAIAVVNDTVFFGTADNYVFAVNALTGEEVWRFEAGGPIIGGVAYSQGVLFAPSLDGALYALQ